jgi:hypothetical protein
MNTLKFRLKSDNKNKERFLWKATGVSVCTSPVTSAYVK